MCGDEHPPVGDEHPPVGDEHPSMCGDEHPPVGDEQLPVGDEQGDGLTDLTYSFIILDYEEKNVMKLFNINVVLNRFNKWG